MINTDVRWANHNRGCSAIETDRFGDLVYCHRPRLDGTDQCKRHDAEDASRDDWAEDWFAA